MNTPRCHFCGKEINDVQPLAAHRPNVHRACFWRRYAPLRKRCAAAAKRAQSGRAA